MDADDTGIDVVWNLKRKLKWRALCSPWVLDVVSFCGYCHTHEYFP